MIINTLRDNAGKLRGFVHVARDVTELKQAEEALRKSWARYQQLVELFPDAVLVQSNGEIVFVNEAATRLLGADNPEQLIRRPLKDIVRPEDWEGLHDHMRRLREEETAFFLKRSRTPRKANAPAAFSEVQLLRLDGTLVNAVIVAAPLNFQDQPAVIVFAYDVRDSRKKPRTSSHASPPGGRRPG